MLIDRRTMLLAGLALPVAATSAHAADRMVISEYGVVLNCLPWAVAQDIGALAQFNTGVDGFVGANGGGTAIRNMMASDLPFAELSVPAAISATRAGIALRFVFNSVNNMGELAWVVPKDSPVHSLQDLKGRKVAFTSPRSTTEMVLRMILNRNNLAGQVTIMPAGGVGAGITALNEGAVDAAPMVDPLLTSAADRYRILFRVNDYIPDLCWSVGVTTPAFAAGNGERIRHLIAARVAGLQKMQADRAEASRVYARVWNIAPDLAARILPKLFDMNFWSPGNFNVPGLQAQVEGMRLVGQLDGPFDVTTLIDRSFLPDSLRT